MREKILELVKATPFCPFRLYLSNGTVHTIRHPEQVLITTSYMVVGIPHHDQSGPDVADTAFVSLLHIVQVEPLSKSLSATAN
jgi:hypothetical protein